MKERLLKLELKCEVLENQVKVLIDQRINDFRMIEKLRRINKRRMDDYK